MSEPQMLELVTRLIKDMDPEMKPTDEGFASAAILLISAHPEIGANEDRIADALGFDPEFVRSVGSRIRNGGGWQKGRLSKRWERSWHDTENGGANFWMHASVAEGNVEIVGTNAEGDDLFRMTPAGIRRVEKMGKS